MVRFRWSTACLGPVLVENVLHMSRIQMHFPSLICCAKVSGTRSTSGPDSCFSSPEELLIPSCKGLTSPLLIPRQEFQYDGIHKKYGGKRIPNSFGQTFSKYQNRKAYTKTSTSSMPNASEKAKFPFAEVANVNSVTPCCASSYSVKALIPSANAAAGCKDASSFTLRPEAGFKAIVRK